MLSINKTAKGNHLTIKLKGEVDASNSVELDEVIQEALNAKRKYILIDGNELDYISSAGLGVFMSYIDDFKSKNIKMVIYGLSEKVLNVFQILGLDQLMTIASDKKEAKEKLHEVQS